MNHESLLSCRHVIDTSIVLCAEFYHQNNLNPKELRSGTTNVTFS